MRKIYFLIVCLFFSNALLCQPIQTNVKATVTVDDFTGNTTIRTDTWNRIGVNPNTWSRHTINAYLLSVGENIIVVNIRYSGDLGCLSQDRSKLLVKLENNEVIEFIQVSRTNCSSNGQSARFLLHSYYDLIEAQDIQNIQDINGLTGLYDSINEQIELLYKYDWISMRLIGSRHRADLSVNPTRRVRNPEQFFRQHIQAIRNAYAEYDIDIE